MMPSCARQVEIDMQLDGLPEKVCPKRYMAAFLSILGGGPCVGPLFVFLTAQDIRVAKGSVCPQGARVADAVPLATT